MPRWADEPVVLDKHDTLHSALAKVESASGGAPCLVIQSGCRIGDNPLTYRLMGRASERLAAPIAVVTSNPRWRQLARQNGLLAYSSVGALRRSHNSPFLSGVTSSVDSFLSALVPSLAGHWVAFTGTILVLSLVIGGAVYLGLPIMKLTVKIPAESITSEVTIAVDANLKSVDAQARAIPGKSVEHRFTVTDYVETTGEKPVGKSPARGEVSITNNGVLAINVPQGTILLSASGQKFKTVAGVSATPKPRPAVLPPPPGSTATPGATPQAQPQAESTKVGVEAVDSGEKGNVAAGTIVRFESAAFGSLAVTNERPLTGGVDAKTKSVSVEDQARLKEAMFQRAQSLSLSELTVRVRQSESLIPHSMQVKIEKEEFEKAPGEETDRLKGSLQILATGMTFANQDFNSIAEGEWKKGLAKGYRPLAGPLDFSPPMVLEAGGKAAKLSTKINGRAERLVELDQLAQAVRGMTVQEARDKVTRMENPPSLMKVEMWPEWAGKAYRVEVATVQ